MQRRASSTPGATKALVGHASRQARQVPQRSASNGRSGTRSASVSTTPMKVNEPRSGSRSEEHTSELQSRFDLVCRLLLEKKKTPSQRQSTRRHSSDL